MSAVIYLGTLIISLLITSVFPGGRQGKCPMLIYPRKQSLCALPVWITNTTNTCLRADMFNEGERRGKERKQKKTGYRSILELLVQKQGTSVQPYYLGIFHI